ncbi:MAG TPA: trypsin-like peptidase domain-containing protein [Thermomonospora sp.]|nr:trypsin-like peptidase domain-containing protein [Thermomonospora sp.]
MRPGFVGPDGGRPAEGQAQYLLTPPPFEPTAGSHHGAPPYGQQYAPAAPPAGATTARGWSWTPRRALLAAAAVVVLAVGAGGAGAAAAVALGDGGSAPTSTAGVSPVSDGKGTAARIAAAVQPAVVSISTQSRTGSGGGSGVILRPDGTIITNAHVVENVDQVQVKLSDGRTASARVLGVDTARDIAVIRATGVSGLKAAPIGDSTGLAVGDPVLAIGSPLGLDGSVTAGIVSALGRTLEEQRSQPDPGLPPGFGQEVRQDSTTIKNAIQTDAAINPGNSGGALVNMSGQVVGINTAIATTGQGNGNIGVGFAIPISDAMKSANQILNTTP